MSLTQGDRLPTVVLYGREKLERLRPVWRSLHDHHAHLQARGLTQVLGPLRDLDDSWAAQRRFYEHALRSPSTFLAVAEADGVPVGYALVVGRSHPVWGDAPVASIEVLCVAPRGGLDAARERVQIVKALFLAGAAIAKRHGMTRWSATCLAANSDVRRLIERRMAGEPAMITYQGSIADAAQRLFSGKNPLDIYSTNVT